MGQLHSTSIKQQKRYGTTSPNFYQKTKTIWDNFTQLLSNNKNDMGQLHPTSMKQPK